MNSFTNHLLFFLVFIIFECQILLSSTAQISYNCLFKKVTTTTNTFYSLSTQVHFFPFFFLSFLPPSFLLFFPFLPFLSLPAVAVFFSEKSYSGSSLCSK